MCAFSEIKLTKFNRVNIINIFLDKIDNFLPVSLEIIKADLTPKGIIYTVGILRITGKL